MYAEYAARPDDAPQHRHRPPAGAAARQQPAADGALPRAAVLAAGQPGPLLRRRDRHGRQHPPRRPRRRAHADAVDAATATPASPRPTSSSSTCRRSGPGVRLPGRQRRVAAAERRLVPALAQPHPRRSAREHPQLAVGSLHAGARRRTRPCSRTSAGAVPRTAPTRSCASPTCPARPSRRPSRCRDYVGARRAAGAARRRASFPTCRPPTRYLGSTLAVPRLPRLRAATTAKARTRRRSQLA